MGDTINLLDSLQKRNCDWPFPLSGNGPSWMESILSPNMQDNNLQIASSRCLLRTSNLHQFIVHQRRRNDLAKRRLTRIMKGTRTKVLCWKTTQLKTTQLSNSPISNRRLYCTHLHTNLFFLQSVVERSPKQSNVTGISSWMVTFLYSNTTSKKCIPTSPFGWPSRLSLLQHTQSNVW